MPEFGVDGAWTVPANESLLFAVIVLITVVTCRWVHATMCGSDARCCDNTISAL